MPLGIGIRTRATRNRRSAASELPSAKLINSLPLERSETPVPMEAHSESEISPSCVAIARWVVNAQKMAF